MIRFITGGTLRRLVEVEEGREMGIWRYKCVFIFWIPTGSCWRLSYDVTARFL